MQHALGTHALQRKSAIVRPRYNGASHFHSTTPSLRALPSCPPRPRPYEVNLVNPGTLTHKASANLSLAASNNDNVHVSRALRRTVSIEHSRHPHTHDHEEIRNDLQAKKHNYQMTSLDLLRWSNATKIKNYTGEPVLLFQYQSEYTRMELSKMSLGVPLPGVNGTVAGSLERVPTNKVPAVVHITLLQNGQKMWLYRNFGENVTIRSYSHKSHYYEINLPLPGHLKRVVINRKTFEMDAADVDLLAIQPSAVIPVANNRT